MVRELAMVFWASIGEQLIENMVVSLRLHVIFATSMQMRRAWLENLPWYFGQALVSS